MATREANATPAGGREAECRLRPWRVIHASEYVRDVLPVIEGQLAIGMRPFIVTPQGCGSAEVYLHAQHPEKRRPASLLRAWQDVRNWRKSISDCDPDTTAEIVHAHSFAAGMAAVRTCPAVVYDVCQFVEEMSALGLETRAVDSGSWMARSFRVAEQFILTRAGAIVVHARKVRDAALERGAEAENVFVIPEPVDLAALELVPDFAWTRSLFPGEHCSLFAPEAEEELNENGSFGARMQHLLRAFALLRHEWRDARLILSAEGEAAERIRREMHQAGMGSSFVVVPPFERQRALASADMVVLFGSDEQASLAAMANGKPVLALDAENLREITADGRGVLWFQGDDPGDLARRAAFLAQHADFRASLGAAAQTHVLESRSMAAVGKRHNEVYDHAFARRKMNQPQAPAMHLQPLTAAI